MKTGDTVKLKDGLKVGRKYGEIELLESMIFEGEKKIETDKEGDIYIDGWYYSIEMLDILTG